MFFEKYFVFNYKNKTEEKEKIEKRNGRKNDMIKYLLDVQLLKIDLN